MREMKDSGVEWMGIIPTNWTTIKFSSFIERMGTGLNPRDNFVLDKESPFYYVTIRNFKNGKLYLDDNCDRISQEAFNIIQERSQLQAGDFLFASISKEPQVFLLNETPCNWNINESVFCIRPKKGIYLTNYLYYLLTDYRFYESLLTDATGSTFLSIKQNKLKQSTLVLPPNDEQQKIAAHLDRKCTQIDALISNAQQQIEKLKAYKQSVITETVTKGLDPDVQMKDSGVEWIGNIPEHWDAAPIRSIFRIKKDIIGHEPETVLSITQSGLKIKDISENSGQMANSYAHYQIVNIGDFAMNHMDLLTGGVGISEFEGVTSPDYRVFVMRNKEMNPRFFLYVFQMYYRNKIFYAFGQGAANIGRWRLPAQNFNTVAIPLAPIEEQNAIVAFLDKKCEQIDQLIALKQQKIEKLQQYKKSVIYEYVTGKKEV
ncbi:restriction endonuclease subunit S [Ruminococcus sp.]|uniref:restriction endonuclease subunit S n=1 Tax=Ruminococcus sp. TaxID=41978 RepID=UPI0025CCAAAD|nr:restriction endonuclease subunit S [Ruminococcus sp.]